MIDLRIQSQFQSTRFFFGHRECEKEIIQVVLSMYVALSTRRRSCSFMRSDNARPTMPVVMRNRTCEVVVIVQVGGTGCYEAVIRVCHLSNISTRSLPTGSST